MPLPEPPRMLRHGHAYVASTASVVADVVLGADANVWYGTVIRGDDAPLTVGARSNVQDGTVIHADTGVRNDIGEDVTIGHGAIVHGARVDRYALVGMGSILLGGSVVGEGAIVAAGCVVPERFVVPAWSLVVGVPAKVVKQLDPDKRKASAIEMAADYVRKAVSHADGRWTAQR